MTNCSCHWPQHMMTNVSFHTLSVLKSFDVTSLCVLLELRRAMRSTRSVITAVAGQPHASHTAHNACVVARRVIIRHICRSPLVNHRRSVAIIIIIVPPASLAAVTLSAARLDENAPSVLISTNQPSARPLPR